MISVCDYCGKEQGGKRVCCEEVHFHEEPSQYELEDFLYCVGMESQSFWANKEMAQFICRQLCIDYPPKAHKVK